MKILIYTANFLLVFAILSTGAAQSTIVNSYTPVLSISCEGTVLTVGSSSSFTAADKVLVMQMQGAKIDTTNTASFGTITDPGSAGNHEFNRIKSINGNQITLQYKLERPYDLAGKVQLIRVPEFERYSADGLTCQPWNGSTGGVLAIEVKDTLTLLTPIDVSQKGFRGGQHVDTDLLLYDETQYYYPTDPARAGGKGEGIAIVQADRSYGRGRAANGGGGGNAHNAGGGGGGNYYNGGRGAYQYYITPAGSPNLLTYGIEGSGLSSLIYPGFNSFRYFMGGGGGAGQGNDFQGTSGGAGGGIVLIQAGLIIGNNQSIIANGQDIFGPGGTNVNDGQGAGGAGGTIVIECNNYSGNLTLRSEGGRGGDCFFYVQNQIIGPGGGGSGGYVLTHLLPPQVTVSLKGGIHGTTNQNSANGSENGQDGVHINLSAPLFVVDTMAAILELTVASPSCKEPNSGSISVANPPAGALFSLNNAPFQPDPMFSGLTSGVYHITQQTPDGCQIDSLVSLVEEDSFIVKQDSFLLCSSDTLRLGDWVITQSGLYQDTLRSITGCDTILKILVNFVPLPEVNREVDFCKGDTLFLYGEVFTMPDTVTFLLPAAVGCDTVATYVVKFRTSSQPANVNIACPADISVQVNPGSGGEMVDFSSTTAMTSCICPGLLLTQASGLPSGSVFPIGDTEVCFSAQDSCGNTAQCCFTVTVTAEDPCDVKTNGCLKFELLSITRDNTGDKTYRIRSFNYCNDDLVYFTAQLPTGVVALRPATGTYYAGSNGKAYLVRNPNATPQHSIRFKTEGSAGIRNGESDIFQYTLPEQSQPAYIHVTAKLSNNTTFAAHLNTAFCPVTHEPSPWNNKPGIGIFEEKYAQVIPKFDIQVYPNPTEGLIYLDLSACFSEMLEIQISDVLGRPIYKESLQNNGDLAVVQLPTNLPSGPYMLFMQDENGRKETLTIIKN